MECLRCQSDNPTGSKFCLECGAELRQVCPQCGQYLPASAKFCNECGNALATIQKKSPVDYTNPQSYTPKHLADKILTSRSAIEGERKIVTVLFADVAGSTAISDRLDPDDVHQIMDGCFRILMDEIHKYEGTINQFTGDGVMALFGAPIAHEDHAQRACTAALSIQNALGDYQSKILDKYGVEFKMRIGLNSGPVVVGAIGDDLRMDYTAVGVTTNLAARMETKAEPGTILVPGDTQRMARDYFKFKVLGSVSVKGKEEAVEAYELLEPTGIETRIGASVAKGLTRFVGRQREIAALKEVFEKAKAGSGQVVGVVGEAGVGKSRLLLELRQEFHQEELTYLEGRCLHYGGSMAYLPLLDIIRSYFDIQHDDREFIIKEKMAEKADRLDDKLKDALPPLQDILSLTPDDEEYLKLDPPLKRVKAFESLRDLLILESRERPLIIAVEDLHWIDSTTEEFLGYLMGSLATSRILLILLYRHEYTHHWGSTSYYSQIGVDQLSPKTSAELVESILAGGEAVPELRELIIARAGGNPFFVEEFTHSLLENGSIRKEDHQYVLSSTATDIHVPDTIQGVIAARMDRLEEELKRTMQVASVIGRDFAYRILHTITGTGDELKACLLNLQGLEFIYEKSLFPELEYIFKHALTQEVAYESLLVKRRKEIHEKIGRAIEELYPDRLEEFCEVLAHHYSRSEDMEKAYHYLEMAGNKATRNYAKSEALSFYHAAIEILNREPDTEENKRKGIEIRLLMTTPMRYLAYPEGSLEILEEGEKLAREVGDERSLAHFYSLISFYYTTRGQPLKGAQYAENSFREAEKVQDIDLMVPIGLELCYAYTDHGDFFKVPEMATMLIAVIEKSQRQSDAFGWGFNVYAAIFATYAYALSFLGDFKEAESLCEKGLRITHEIDDLYCIGYIEQFYSLALCIKGDGDRAIKHAQDAVKHNEETQFLTLLPHSWGVLGWGHILLGELDKGRIYTEKGLEIQLSSGIPMHLSSQYIIQSRLHFELGDLEKAQSHIEEALELAQNGSEKHYEALAKIWLGKIQAKADMSQSDNAEELISDGIRELDKLKLRPWITEGYLYLGELYADTGQNDKALENLKKAEAEFKDMGMDYWLNKAQEALAKAEV